MRAYVFTDAALERHAGRFVWLSMDTEQAEAAAFLERFPISSWPTLLVIDPATERAVLKWLGSATVPQLEKLLEDGERAVKGSARGLEARLAAADQAFAQGQANESARLSSQLVASAPRGWARRPRAIELWLLSLLTLEKTEECASLADRELKTLPRGPSYAAVAGLGLDCALQEPSGGKPDHARLVGRLEKAVDGVLRKRDIAIAADDYSGLFASAVEARKWRGDEASARKLAETWVHYLEEQAAKAPGAEARAVFDGHRLSAYLLLGQPEKAVAMLQASEQALPDDFTPPARLAVAYRELGRHEDALAAADRALARAHGPRRLRILSVKAEVLAKKGDPESARKVLDDALAFAAGLPEAQRSERVIGSLRKQRDELK